MWAWLLFCYDNSPTTETVNKFCDSRQMIYVIEIFLNYIFTHTFKEKAE